MTKLTIKQQQAAIHLAAGDSKTEVARKIGVNPCTIHRWMNDEGFEATVAIETRNQIEALRKARMPLLG